MREGHFMETLTTLIDVIKFTIPFFFALLALFALRNSIRRLLIRFRGHFILIDFNKNEKDDALS